MTHTIKLKEQFCDDVLNGKKCFEVRKNDRDYKVGDLVKFVPIRPLKIGPLELSLEIQHEVSKRQYEITYVLSGWGISEGYVVFGIKAVIV